MENPFLVIRNLHALTSKVLLIESIVLSNRWSIANLVNKGQSQDQSLRHIAFVPYESCLIKMLYHASFPFIYTLTTLPYHEDFRQTRKSRRKRTMLITIKAPLQLSLFRLVAESLTKDSWMKPGGYKSNA